MADTVEMADIRGLDIDKTVKGFALREYIFKNDCTVSSMSGDSVRWYQETASDLTATAPAVVANISPLSTFPTLEVSWTRNTSSVKKYAAKGFLSMEDSKSADVDIVARTLLRLTRAVVKQVDSDIWNVLTESQTPVNINSVTSTAAWDAASGQNPFEDVAEALMDIEQYDYDTSNAVLYLSPKDKKSLLTWIVGQGAAFPGVSSEKLESGSLLRFAGCTIKVSNNVTADYAAVVVPQKACTWKSYQDTTAVSIEDKGVGTEYRVYELGVALLTDPKAVALISNTQA